MPGSCKIRAPRKMKPLPGTYTLAREVIVGSAVSRRSSHTAPRRRADDAVLRRSTQPEPTFAANSSKVPALSLAAAG